MRAHGILPSPENRRTWQRAMRIKLSGRHGSCACKSARMGAPHWCATINDGKPATCAGVCVPRSGVESGGTRRTSTRRGKAGLAPGAPGVAPTRGRTGPARWRRRQPMPASPGQNDSHSSPAASADGAGWRARGPCALRLRALPGVGMASTTARSRPAPARPAACPGASVNTLTT